MNETENSVLNIKPARKILGLKITKKRVIWTVIGLLIIAPIAYGVFKPKDNSANIQTDTVKKQDLKATVLATGQVVSETDLKLSFKSSGIVSQVLVKEGVKVKAGQTLATLEMRDAAASLTSARGALAQAQANYNRVLSGASNEDIALAQVAVDNAQTSLDNTKKQQQVLVDNAYKSLLNTGLSADANTGNTSTVVPQISGVYSSKEQGVYIVTIYPGSTFQYRGLESGGGNISTVAQPLGKRGLYIYFPSISNLDSNNSWTVEIPNTQAAGYVAAYNSYQSALENQIASVSAAESALATAKASLNLKKAAARPADLEAAQAQVLSAQGQVQAASALVSNSMIVAPSDGTITSVNIKVGELASAATSAIVLQDVGNLHVEANVSEANIASLEIGQDVDITFDSLGSDRHFTGKVQTVNPGASVVSGVVNYKVTASIPEVEGVKPGMTANMTVLTSEKFGVLTIPSRAVVKNNGSKVRVIDDTKKKTYHEVDVKTGLEADGGLVEIISGLSEGQEVVTYVKQ